MAILSKRQRTGLSNGNICPEFFQIKVGFLSLDSPVFSKTIKDSTFCFA